MNLPNPTADPPTCYAIARWGELFENNESRKLDNLRWFPMRVLLADESFAELLDDDDGPADFAVFVALLMVAATARPRGHLLKANGTPQDARSIARQIRMPLATVEHAMARLIAIGLVLSGPVPPPATDSRASGSESRSVGNGSRSSGPYIGHIEHTGEEREESRSSTSEAADEAAADDDEPSLLLIGELNLAYKLEDLPKLTKLIQKHGVADVRMVLQDAMKKASKPHCVIPYAAKIYENAAKTKPKDATPASLLVEELGIIGCNTEGLRLLNSLLEHSSLEMVKLQLVGAIQTCGANQSAISYAARAIGDAKATSTPQWMVDWEKKQKAKASMSARFVREDR
jgi:hypothetical protein